MHRAVFAAIPAALLSPFGTTEHSDNNFLSVPKGAVVRYMCASLVQQYHARVALCGLACPESVSLLLQALRCAWDIAHAPDATFRDRETILSIQKLLAEDALRSLDGEERKPMILQNATAYIHWRLVGILMEVHEVNEIEWETAVSSVASALPQALRQSILPLLLHVLRRDYKCDSYNVVSRQLLTDENPRTCTCGACFACIRCSRSFIRFLEATLPQECTLASLNHHELSIGVVTACELFVTYDRLQSDSINNLCLLIQKLHERRQSLPDPQGEFLEFSASFERLMADRYLCDYFGIAARLELSRQGQAKAMDLVIDQQFFAVRVGSTEGLEAMVTLIQVLVASNKLAEAVTVAVQLSSLSNERHKMHSESKLPADSTFISKHNLEHSLMSAHFSNAHVLFLVKKDNRALQHVFQALALCESHRRRSPCLLVDQIYAPLLGFCWRIFLRLGKRLSSATWFYKHITSLKEQSASTRTLSQAYIERGELLLQFKNDLSTKSGECTSGKEEEAISMFKAAVEMCESEMQRTSSSKDKQHRDAALSSIDCYRAISHVYIGIAMHEGNKRQREQMIQEALNASYKGRELSEKYTMRMEEADIAVADALLFANQYRKAAMLVYPVLEASKEAVGSSTTSEVRRACHNTIAALKILGKCFVHLDPQQAVTCFNELLACLDTRPYAFIHNREKTRHTADAHCGLGDAFLALKQYEGSLQGYSAALGLYDQVEDKRGEGEMFGNLSKVYLALKEPEKALNYLQQMHDLGKEAGEAVVCYEATLTMANVHSSLKQYKEAMAMWSSVLHTARLYDNCEIERATARSLICAQKAQAAFGEVIQTATALDKLAVAWLNDSSNTGSSVKPAPKISKAAKMRNLNPIVQKVSQNMHGRKTSTLGGSSTQREKAIEDRCFALENMANAYLKLGQYDKCLNVISDFEKQLEELEDVDEGTVMAKFTSVTHDTRAQALMALHNTDAALDVLATWRSKAVAAQRWNEVAKACSALADYHASLQNGLNEAKNYSISAIQAAEMHLYPAKSSQETDCNSNSQAPHIEPVERIEMVSIVMRAAKWLVSEYYLVKDKSNESQHERFEETQDGGLHAEAAMALGAIALDTDQSVHVGQAYDLRAAVEVIEIALRICLPFEHVDKPERSPAEVVSMCFSQNDDIAFVFFFSVTEPPEGNEADLLSSTSLLYNIIVKPAQCPFLLHGRTDKPYRHQSESCNVGNRHAQANDSDEADYFSSLRHTYDVLWDPILKLLAPIFPQCQNTVHMPAIDPNASCVVVVPDPSLFGIPFGALLNQQRRSIIQQIPIVIAPTLEHFMHYRPMCCDNRMADCSSKILLTKSHTTFEGYEMVAPRHLDVVCSATRKEYARIFTDPHYAAILLCETSITPPSKGKLAEHFHRIADGRVSLESAGATISFDSRTELVGCTVDRKFPSGAQHCQANPALALCVTYGAKRVLRIDANGPLSPQHESILQSFLQYLQMMEMKQLTRNMFATALQVALVNAIRKRCPPNVWGAFSIVGVP